MKDKVQPEEDVKYSWLYGQVRKRAWRMPWRQEAMKDVPICEKLRGADKGRQSSDVRMGEPSSLMLLSPSLDGEANRGK